MATKHPGTAHIPGLVPELAHLECRQCAHWKRNAPHPQNRFPVHGRCLEAARLAKRDPGPVPESTTACKFFAFPADCEAAGGDSRQEGSRGPNSAGIGRNPLDASLQERLAPFRPSQHGSGGMPAGYFTRRGI